MFGGSWAKLEMAGFMVMYMSYDCFHYFIHHMTSQIEYLNEMKKYHIKHHYVNGDSGYGITTKLWDIVYGTKIPDNVPNQK